MNLNKVFLIGRLGMEPETKTFQNGGKICIINLGVNDPYFDKNENDWKSNTSWIRCVFSDKVADRAQYLHKGDEILVEGKIKPRSFEDSNGNKRFITEVKGTFKKGRLGRESRENKERKEPINDEVLGEGDIKSDDNNVNQSKGDYGNTGQVPDEEDDLPF